MGLGAKFWTELFAASKAEREELAEALETLGVAKETQPANNRELRMMLRTRAAQKLLAANEEELRKRL